VPNDKHYCLEKQRLQQEKHHHQENQRQARTLEIERATRERAAMRQASAHHKENMSFLQRVKKAEWVRWIITTIIALCALAIGTVSFFMHL